MVWIYILVMYLNFTWCKSLTETPDFIFVDGYVPPRGIDKNWYRYKGLTSTSYNLLMNLTKEYTGRTEDDRDKVLDSDILYTPQQISRKIDHSREKRKIHKDGTLKWSTAIKVRIDDQNYNEKEMSTIKKAFRMWEEKTCLTFMYIPVDEDMPEHHMFVTKDQDGQGNFKENSCSSYIGKIDEFSPAQPVFVGSDCLSLTTAIMAHEIGHALTLFHEHSRPDRDLYVSVFQENIKPDAYRANFDIEDNIATMGLPYDYGSVMHYGVLDFSIDKETPKFSILPKMDSRLNSALGQRSHISFHDVEVINKAYCPDMCGNSNICQNGGYPDRNNCFNCICPDLYAGRLCEKFKDTGSSGCSPNSGTLDDIRDGQVHCLKTPGYNTNPRAESGYTSNDECTWVLQVPPSCSAKLWFTGDDSWPRMPQLSDDTCTDWVEIKYQGLQQKIGPRFCGLEGLKDFMYNSSHPLVTSSSNIPIMFRSFEFVEPWEWFYTLGFELCYTLEDVSCLFQTSTEMLTTGETTVTTMTEQLTTTDHMTSTEQPTTTEHMTSTAQPTTTEHITSTEQSTTTVHITSTEQSTTTEHMTSTDQPTTTEHITSTEQPTTTEHITSTEQPTTTEHITSTEQPTTTEHITSTDQPTTTEHITSTEQLTTIEHITSTKQPTTAEHITSTERPTTTEHMPSTERLTTTEHMTSTNVHITSTEHLTTTEHVTTNNGKPTTATENESVVTSDSFQVTTTAPKLTPVVTSMQLHQESTESNTMEEQQDGVSAASLETSQYETTTVALLHTTGRDKCYTSREATANEISKSYDIEAVVVGRQFSAELTDITSMEYILLNQQIVTQLEAALCERYPSKLNGISELRFREGSTILYVSVNLLLLRSEDDVTTQDVKSAVFSASFFGVHNLTDIGEAPTPTPSMSSTVPDTLSMPKDIIVATTVSLAVFAAMVFILVVYCICWKPHADLKSRERNVNYRIAEVDQHPSSQSDILYRTVVRRGNNQNVFDTIKTHRSMPLEYDQFRKATAYHQRQFNHIHPHFAQPLNPAHGFGRQAHIAANHIPVRILPKQDRKLTRTMANDVVYSNA